MKIIKAIQRHPLLTFYALAFVISWGSQLLLIGGPAAMPAKEGEIEALLLPIYLALLAGPSLTAIILIALLDGRAGLHDFGRRLFKWRVGVRWYALALLTSPLAMAAVLLALSLISLDFLPRIYTEANRGFLLQFSIISALIVGIFEEIGWTGFATPRLRKRHGVLVTGLVVGLLLGVWQLLVVYWVGGSYGAVPVALFLAASLFSWQPAYRVLMVWVYDHTGSLLLAILMHIVLVTFWTLLTPLTIVGVPLVTYYLLLAATFWLAVAAVAAAGRKHLSPRAPRPQMV